jgi:hypothetical protein
VEFVIQLLREKKKEIQREYKEDPDFIKTQACDLMTKQIKTPALAGFL